MVASANRSHVLNTKGIVSAMTMANEAETLLGQAQDLIDSLIRELPDEERYAHWLVRACEARRRIATHVAYEANRQSSDQSSGETPQLSYVLRAPLEHEHVMTDAEAAALGDDAHRNKPKIPVQPLPTRPPSDMPLEPFDVVVLKAMDKLGAGGEIRIRHRPFSSKINYGPYEISAQTEREAQKSLVYRGECRCAKFDLMADILRCLVAQVTKPR
ncbi:MAG: hypothetical protein EHM48_10325 [Planctomycetaceae bacterium]|nr:MAG: hypothetical protein EHM48_10325 [Planctomycetaceae bacterium]